MSEDDANADSAGGSAADAEHDAVEAGDETASGGDGPGGERDSTATDLVARIAAHDEALAGEVGDRLDRVEELEGEVADLESRLKRSRADFQNYKKRAKEREAEIRERATEDLVERLLDVRDNLVRAVEQDDDVDVRDGVEATLSTFDRVLEGENVSAIEPAPGEEIDPERHEVVHRTESEEPAGTIAAVYRPGYAMAGKVLRAAQVTVSEGPQEAADEGEPEAPEE